MFRNNSVSNREKSDNKDNNNCELYLTPFSPEEINDEIYSGEELKIKPIDLNIIINANSKSTKINNIYATINTNINKISIINTNENIKSKTILSLSRNSFSLINNNKKNSFNINQLKISENNFIKISSEYENINKISKYKYCKDKQFQSEVKKYIKQNYLDNRKKQKNAEIINDNYFNFNKRQYSLSTSVIPQVNKNHIKKKENIFPIHNTIAHSSNKFNPNTSDNQNRFKISDKIGKVNKRGTYRIRSSNTQIDKFYNRKPFKVKKRSTLLNEITNNINVLNHPNEFYSRLLNNIIKDRDNRSGNYNQEVEIKRNSKTIKERDF
jgi:hypothetical protein